mmetsp:Transcript_12029/g.40880  ORF Transcript_12029/g.40880 Transcript_12029/m.40880 type:complete len:395 (-) Transcript_12029:211-1395(-)
MDPLKAEIERKRKQQQELTGGKKWVRRGEIEQRRAEEYLQKHMSKAPQAAPAADARAPAADEAAEADVRPTIDTSLYSGLTDADIMKRLRALFEPIALFGEAREDRLVRYHRLAESIRDKLDANQELRKGQFFNERQMQERNLLEQLLNTGQDMGAGSSQGAAASGSGSGTAGGGAASGDASGPAPLSDVLDGIARYLRDQGWSTGAPTEAPDGDAVKGSGEDDALRVLQTMHALLSEWQDELLARMPEEARSSKGKHATLTFQETTRHLKPLIQLLRQRNVPADIFAQLVKIFRHVHRREYVKAMDAYVLAAIGNAPWPIGVTMVGIHVRAAREKIQSTLGAHVMNDETQRKYLTAVKRLITFAQRKHPTLPSQMVLHWNYDKDQAAGASGSQ